MRTKLFGFPIGRAMVALGAIIFLSVPLLSFHHILLEAVDYKTVYSSAKSMSDGHDPYISANLRTEYARSGGDVSAASDMSAFKPFQALYPPSSLFLVLPFTWLPYKTALALWLALIGLLFVTASFLMAEILEDWSSPMPMLLLGLFLATSMMLFLTAQPSGVAISLCIIGVWSLLRQRYLLLGSICFAVSLVLKPQIGGLVLLYFLLARGENRRKAMMIALLAGLLSVPGLWMAARTPAAAHWPQEMSRNIAGSSVHGSTNDPGPDNYNGMLIADLQPVVAIFINKSQVYNRVAWTIGGSLLLIWAYVAWRAPGSRKKDLLGLAAVACLSLLPIYHRNYDVRLLLLTLPASAMLIAEGGAAGMTAIWMSIAVIFGSHSTFVNNHIIPHVGQETHWKELLLLRTTPLVVMACGIFYLVLFARTLRGDVREQREQLQKAA